VTGRTVAATGEPPRSAAAAAGPQQVATATTAVMTMAAATLSTLPVPVPTGGNQVAVVDVPDDDVPPLGWGQWESLPAPAPEPPARVLMMREDGCMMSRRSTHGAEASSSRAALPASDGTAARPKQERERVNVPPAHFSEAQAEQVLWQEFRDHGVSLNRALNEALRIHGGPVWCVFKICSSRRVFRSFRFHFFRICASPDPCLLSLCPPAVGVGGSGPGKIRHSTPSTPSSRP
jgi:hypothetical protein